MILPNTNNFTSLTSPSRKHEVKKQHMVPLFFPGFTSRILVFLIGLYLLVFIPLIAGCSPFPTIKKTTKKITHIFNFSDKKLKKKVGIALFENQSLITGLNFAETFPDNLAEAIKETCPAILLVKPGDAGCPDLLVELPREVSGRLDNLALAKTGRRLGYDAIVTGALMDIKTNSKKHGILWFKDTDYILQLKIMVEVYDTETGAKLLDESYTDEIKIDMSESEPIMGKYRYDPSAINDAILHVAKIIGRKICESLNSQPWKGYVISIKGNKVAVSAGSKAGLEVGQILEVYDSVKTIEGANSRKFFIPGLKTGEIKITAVYPDRADAISVSGKVVWTGSTVKLKK